jgi:hypothetical protein
MDDGEAAATAFPIYEDAAAFNRFFVDGRKGSLRGRLYGDVERRALKCVQPFALTDEALESAFSGPLLPQDDLRTDHAYVLNALWNIDKHRHLPGIACAVGPVWFEGIVPGYRCVSHVEELTPIQDGVLIGELHGSAGSDRAQVTEHWEIELVLTDDPSPYRMPLVPRLERLHQSLEGWMVPRIFIVADGNPPPIMITSSSRT